MENVRNLGFAAAYDTCAERVKLVVLRARAFGPAQIVDTDWRGQYTPRFICFTTLIFVRTVAGVSGAH